MKVISEWLCVALKYTKKERVEGSNKTKKLMGGLHLCDDED